MSCGTQVSDPRPARPVRDCHPVPSAFPDRSRPHRAIAVRPSNPHAKTWVWAARRSLATTSRMLSFPRATEMFQLAHLPSRCRDDLVEPRPGFPIRTSPLQTPAHGWAALLAVYHVRHRQPAARHPPDALVCLPRCCGEMTLLACDLLCALVKLPGGFPPPLPTVIGTGRLNPHPRQKQPGIPGCGDSSIPFSTLILLW